MKNQISQPLLLALCTSAVLHGLFFLLSFTSDIQQTAKGHNQIFLLEASANDHPRIKPQAENKIQGAAEISQTQGKIHNLNTRLSSAMKNSLTADQKKPIIQTGNQGNMLDQSGKALSAEQKYQHLVYQHLLKNMESSPYTGSARVSLRIIGVGIATNIEVIQTAGNSTYKKWLMQKILSSNPFPALPDNIKERPLAMSISFQHQTEP